SCTFFQMESGDNPVTTRSSKAEWARIETFASLEGVQLARAQFENRVFPVHAHAEFVIGAVIEGTKETTERNFTFRAPAAETGVHNPFAEHCTRPAQGGWRFIAAYPTPAAMEFWSRDTGVGSKHIRFSSPLAGDPRGARLLTRLVAEGRRGVQP